MLPFGVTIFSFFTHTGEKKYKEETTAGWEGMLTFLIAMIRNAARLKAPPILWEELSAQLTEGGSLSRKGKSERAI